MKKYIKPQCIVIKGFNESPLLAGSTPGDNGGNRSKQNTFSTDEQDDSEDGYTYKDNLYK